MTDDFEAALRAVRDATECPIDMLRHRAYPGDGNCFRCDCARALMSDALDGEGSDTDALRALYDAGREQGRREQQALLAEAAKALERLESRKGEDVGEWAQRLAKDVGNATD